MLDRNSPVPLYHQLSEQLLGQILDGHLQPRDAIPTERELIETYAVSRITVRRAMAELESRGFVQREQGRGTFVRPPQVHRLASRLTSFSEEIAARGMVPGAQLLAFRKEPATGRVAHELQIEAGAPVWMIERLRSADSEAIVVNVSYLHLPEHVQVTEEEVKAEVSLWALLGRKGIPMVEARRTIEAIAADDREAGFLHVAVGSPLLLVEGVVYTQNSVPVEFYQIIGRADRYKYQLHVTR